METNFPPKLDTLKKKKKKNFIFTRFKTRSKIILSPPK